MAKKQSPAIQVIYPYHPSQLEHQPPPGTMRSI